MNSPTHFNKGTHQNHHILAPTPYPNRCQPCAPFHSQSHPKVTIVHHRFCQFGDLTLMELYRICSLVPNFFWTFLKIEVQLIYSVSGVQQNDSILYIGVHIYMCIYIFFFRFFSIIGYYKVQNMVPCAIQQALVIYLFYIQQCVSVNPKFPIYLPQLLKPAHLVPMLYNKRSHHNEKRTHYNKEQPPLDTTRESPHAATKTQCNKK